MAVMPGQNAPSWLRYSNQSATRNDPIAPAIVSSMSFLGDMGITMDVISGGQESNKPGEGTGSERHNHGNSADVDFYKDGRKLDWNNPNDLPLLQNIVMQAKSNGITGIGAGDDYMGPGRFHIGFGKPAVWGAGGKGANAPAWLVEAYNGAPLGQTPDVTGGAGSATLAGGGADDDLSGLAEWAGIAPPAAQEPQQPAPMTPAQAYASTGALDVGGDLGGRAEWAGITISPAAQPETPVGSYLPGAVMGATPEDIARAQSVQPPATMMDQFTRGLGLGARNMIEGVASVPNMIADPAAALAGYMTGRNVQAPSQALSGALPLPVPETSGERMAGAVQQGAISALTGAGAARSAAGALTGTAQQVARSMGANIPAQVFGGAGAGAGAQGAAEMGFGPMGQLAAGVGGAVLGGGVVAGAQGAFKPKPPTQGGVASQGARPAAAARIEPPVTATPADVQGLLSAATKGGRSSRAAIAQLAAIAQVDKTVLDAAERLGIDLPIDVFSKSIPVREVAGAIRGLKMGEAATDFWANIEAAQTKASGVMSEISEATSLADISDDVLRNLKGTQESLKSQADTLYADIDGSVPKSAPVAAPKTSAKLAEISDELGGPAQMTSAERRLLSAVTNKEKPLTYAGLVRIKQDIGEAIGRGAGPFSGVGTGALKRLYGPLADDQLQAVEALAGAGKRKALELANNLVAQRKAMEDQIIDGFGRDMNGSIASSLKNAVRSGSKGDIAGLNKILGIVPEGLRKRAIGAAISDLSKSQRSSAPGFGFTEFAKMYSGLRSNAPVYNSIAKVLGPEAHNLLTDLYQVSSAVNRATAAIPKTGAANQILEAGLGAEGLITRILKTTSGKAAVRATTTASGGIAGGIPGAIAADAIGSALASPKKDAVTAAGKLFASDEFKKAAVSMATNPNATGKAMAALRSSPAFSRWAKVVGLQNPIGWLTAAMGAEQNKPSEKAK